MLRRFHIFICKHSLAFLVIYSHHLVVLRNQAAALAHQSRAPAAQARLAHLNQVQGVSKGYLTGGWIDRWIACIDRYTG